MSIAYRTNDLSFRALSPIQYRQSVPIPNMNRMEVKMPYVTYCNCGCGATPESGGLWMRGHALRHAAILRSQHHRGFQAATRELYDRGWSLTGGPSPASSPRAFGFEAEFFGISQEYAVDVLNQARIPAQDDGYHHSPRPYWRITEDGSVSGEGCELVSPILRMTQKQAIVDSRMAVSELASAGGAVNRSCGLHVHHNLKRKTVNDVAETVAHWAMFQPVINRILPASRAHASYATGMYDASSWYNGVERHSAACTDAVTSLFDSARNGRWGRYHAINLEAIGAHGTLEYRQHSGTLNPNKLEHWIHLTRAFHDVAKVGSWQMLANIYGGANAVGDAMTVEDMCKYLGLSMRTRKFYIQRELDLMNYPEDEGADEGNENGEDDDYDSGYEDGEQNEDGQTWCQQCDQWHDDE